MPLDALGHAKAVTAILLLCVVAGKPPAQRTMAMRDFTAECCTVSEKNEFGDKITRFDERRFLAMLTKISVTDCSPDFTNAWGHYLTVLKPNYKPAKEFALAVATTGHLALRKLPVIAAELVLLKKERDAALVECVRLSKQNQSPDRQTH